ncbi:hypothetical protein L6164_017538 [Bauhinia variegata]|uniref:Uncharacterized protein n=1 Tax=Bauhinia variegata TaxID=167791 RepID=A0ACB9N8T9_BAUVA|nr:hypothetical protein L6164_017538 [Bauhinia variegata]
MGIKLAIVFMIAFATSAVAGAQPLSGCPSSCGGVEIPYPFGVGTQEGTTNNCFLDLSFNLTCDGTKLWANTSQVSTISLQGQLELYMPISRLCYNESGGVVADEQPSLAPAFTVSNRENKFISVGCNTYGYLNSFKNNSTYSTGCISKCQQIPDKENTGVCSGIGCCQVDIPVGMMNIMVDAYSFGFDARVWAFNNCSYSFVAKNGWFNFTVEDLRNLRYKMTPLVIDWAVGNQTCETAPYSQDYACRSYNTECDDTGSGYGYRCKCKEGFEGNPYQPDGCRDKDECVETKPCSPNGICNNLIGSYECSCPDGYEGDGRNNGIGCSLKGNSGRNTSLMIALKLLTSKRALSFDRPEEERNLSVYFVSSLNEGRLLQILDNHIIRQANVEQLMEVANIAKRCLMVKGEDRPTMKEVAMELEGLRLTERHPWGYGNTQTSSEETLHLLIPDTGDDVGVNGTNTEIDSIKQISILWDGGR